VNRDPSGEIDYELPRDLSREEISAVISALERYFTESRRENRVWALAGRIDNCRWGALQTRHEIPEPWRLAARLPYARYGTPNFHGRGDAR
jgi:hypothetical protein